MNEKERPDHILGLFREAEEIARGRRVLEVLENPRCKCGEVGKKGRLCPYAADIKNEDVLCGCCDACEMECCADV